MVYAVNKFRHYLLGNKFIFYVDHLTLQYLVNKPQVSGRLAWWLLLFLVPQHTQQGSGNAGWIAQGKRYNKLGDCGLNTLTPRLSSLA